MKAVLVSIIMPIKNAAQWVTETIESIQSQSEDNWELIVVDDHSSDNSTEIVEHLVQNDERIRLFKNRETGIISALQHALQESVGTFITRMDADDIMPNQRLEQMIGVLKNHSQKTIVTGKVQYFSEEEVSAGYLKYQDWLNARVDKVDFYANIYRECIVASPNWMGYTEQFKKDGLFEHLNYPEDYDLCFHWQQKSYQIIGIPATTLLWREHPARTSRNSENYQQNAFFKLKMDWFQRNFTSISSLGIVGMGQKGKLCLEHLKNAPFPIRLFDLNHEQFSQSMHGKPVEAIDTINTEMILIARYPNDLTSIQKFIEKQSFIFGQTAFWV